MMRDLNEKTSAELYRFAQRRLKSGELFLLGKVISDHVDLPSRGESNLKIYLLTKRPFIDNVIFGLGEYIYIPEEDRQKVYDVIAQLVMWRSSVAYTPGNIIFNGDPKTVVDDLSGLLRFVDMSDVCGVCDVVLDANHLCKIFTEVCQFHITSVGGADVA